VKGTGLRPTSQAEGLPPADQLAQTDSPKEKIRPLDFGPAAHRIICESDSAQDRAELAGSLAAHGSFV
jgi:hypothetical protein